MKRHHSRVIKNKRVSNRPQWMAGILAAIFLFALLQIPRLHLGAEVQPRTELPVAINEYVVQDQLRPQAVDDGSYRTWGTVKGSFASSGVSFGPPDNSDRWQVRFVLDDFNGLSVTDPSEFLIQDDTVIYRRGTGLKELYQNQSNGVAQKFIIDQAAPLSRLELVGHFETNLSAERINGQGVVFRDTNGVPQFTYGEATLIDARGIKVPMELSLDRLKVRLSISPHLLSVLTPPFTIDPLLTTPILTLDPTDQANANFGWTAFTAGDVNGDGYSDVIVAAPFYDGEATDEGRAYVYHGSSTGLSSTPAWTADPTNQTNAQFAFYAYTAGDVNGDGYSDVIVAAPFYDGEATNEGRAYVYHGSSTGLSSTPAWTVDPTDQANAQLGFFAGQGQHSGDVNGDGFDDVLLAAAQFDAQATDEGRTYAYYGSSSGLSLTPNWVVDPTNQASANFGSAIAHVGDVNSDGFADVAVGADTFDAEFTNEGRVFVFHGGAAGLATTPALTLDPTDQVTASFGGSVGPAGDVNGDGYADMIVGASNFDAQAINEGRAYLYYGGASGLASSPAWTADPTDQANAVFGGPAGTAGDVNGDGYGDVYIPAVAYDGEVVDEGRAYVYYGSATGLALSPSWTADPTNQASAFLQWGGTAGDVNGDGFSDVIVAAYQFDAQATNEGRAYLFMGSPDGVATTSAWNVDPTDQANAWFGYSGAFGDVNGDGFLDIVSAAPQFDTQITDEGRVYVYQGTASGPSSTPTLTLDPTDQAVAGFGSGVALGDFNSDGFADSAIGACCFDTTIVDEGRVYIFNGSSSGLGTAPALTLDPTNQIDAEFGVTQPATGDVNGDGFADLVVSAIYYDGEATNEGRVYVYHGSASGLSATPSLTLDPTNQANAVFGKGGSISLADFNGDGYEDAVVGSDFDAQATDEGRVYVYHGSAAGLSSTPALTLDPTDQATATFGSVVTSTDVNSDGYADAVIAATRFDAQATDEGRVYVYHGSAAGLSSTPALTLDPTDQAGAGFGNTLLSGDVNGDGFSDVAIGAAFFDAQAADEGRVYVYYGSAAGLSDAPAFTSDPTDQANAQLGSFPLTTMGDVNGDGYSDMFIGAHLFDAQATDEGRMYLFYGGGGQGLALRPEQRRTDGSVLIATGAASDSTTSALVRLQGKTPAGRGRVRLEVEAKPGTTAFDGLGTFLSAVTDTGLTGATISQLLSSLTANGTPYHWRARLRYNQSPLTYYGGQVSRWVSLAGPGRETDFRTANAAPTVSGLSQRVSGTANAISVGAGSVNNRLVFEAVGTDDGSTYTLEVEVKSVGSAFDGTNLSASSSAITGQTASVEIQVGTAGSNHWQARARDSRGLAGAFVSFGDNNESQADFRIVQLAPPPPGTPNVTPYIAAPVAGDAVVMGATTIRWYLADRATDEDGFLFHDVSENPLIESNEKNLTYFEEVNLTPNTTYCDRHAHAKKGVLMSQPTADYPCLTTFADTPPQPQLTTTEDRARIVLDAGMNPPLTLYAILIEDRYVQLDGTLGINPFSQTRDEWGGHNGISIPLKAGAYTVSVIAQNLDGRLTEPSGSLVFTLGKPLLVVAKAVAINLPESAIFQEATEAYQPLAQTANPIASTVLLLFGSFTLISGQRSGLRRRHRRACLFGTAAFAGIKLGLVLTLALFGFEVRQTLAEEDAFRADGEIVRVGDVLTYELRVSNDGGPTTSAISVWDPLPLGTKFMPGSVVVGDKLLTELPDQDEAEVVRDILHVRLREVPAEGLVSIRFSVFVSSDARDAIGNSMVVSGQDLPVAARSNRTLNPAQSLLVGLETIHDLDQDGLSDSEERWVHRTNPENTDTDGDGYADGLEIKNGYNPLGPGRLLR